MNSEMISYCMACTISLNLRELIQTQDVDKAVHLNYSNPQIDSDHLVPLALIHLVSIAAKTSVKWQHLAQAQVKVLWGMHLLDAHSRRKAGLHDAAA